MSDERPGYTDTPRIPGSEYRVHDAERPHPRVVDPRGFVEKEPPGDATVLFDGTDLSAWEGADGGEPEWQVEDGAMVVEPGSGDVRTREAFGDCQLHVEWAAPEEAEGDSQGRGNSGVFLMDRYEIQVLDCYENPTYADGHAAAVYGQHPPLVNACRPPGEWQSYDVAWTAPRFDGDELVSPARVTVLHNGVVVQDGAELVGPTGHRDVSDYEPHPPEAPLRLQDHGDRVRFRNVWYRSL
ncbi:MAG: DUF1080 domain-containing protein [Halobacteriaceae archaeon]